jgi:hypothetical protein
MEILPKNKSLTRLQNINFLVMKTFLNLSLVFLFTFSLHAQVGIGNTDPQGALDITSTTDGLLIPRVALTSTTVLPLGFLTPTMSELVYNTATTGDVTPGFYYLSTITGTPWVRLAGAVSGTNWEILGNANIIEGTNFMGTTTDTDVAFRRNNAAAGRIGTTSTSFGLASANINTGAATTAFGVNALALNTSAQGNTAIGYSALAANNGTGGTMGSFNTAVGINALLDNTTGRFNTALGSNALGGNEAGEYNIGIGSNAQLANGGSNNIAIGVNALMDNTATGNVAIGHQALRTNTNGAGNTAIGYLALFSSNGGGDNTAVGSNALILSNGFQNVGLGFNALYGNTGGSANIGIGWNAGAANAEADNNIAIGYEAMLNNRANNNLAIGFQAMRANQVSPNNTAIGYQAMSQLNDAASQNNLAVGYQAMQSSAGNISGNSFFGSLAGRKNTGDFCTGIGMRALGSRNAGPSSGVFNTAVGYQSLSFNTTGMQNTAIGVNALFASTSGDFNTALGFEAGSGLSSGNSNTMLGYQSGNTITTGLNNTTLGFQAQVATAAGSNQIRIGNTAITVIAGQVGFTNASDRRFKDNIKNSGLGLDFLQTLRPVSYIRKNDKMKRTEYGFIAQELEEALNTAGDKNNAIISIDDAGMYGVRYNDFISITVKAVQEQQTLIEALQKQNAELKQINTAILKRLDALEKNN